MEKQMVDTNTELGASPSADGPEYQWATTAPKGARHNQ